jgi:protein arginine kinase
MITDLAKRPGPWLLTGGPRSDIVISSRIRLARNLAGYPFLPKLSDEQRDEIALRIKGIFEADSERPNWSYLDLRRLDELDCQLLVERHLISRQLAEHKGTRGVSVSRDEGASVMVNEEDHLRLQVVRGGLQLRELWGQINTLDDRIESRVEYAFHPRYGYLSACPTNVGTGIRVSVMLHLPALKLTGEIERVFRAAKDMHLAVRGLYGEGTEATGDFFQISNQSTIGRTEEEIIDDFLHLVIPSIINYENRERQSLLDDKSVALDDKIYRSYGTLLYARTISSEETMKHLSHVRLGIHLGRIKDVDVLTVNELFLLTQPAHLQKIHGSRLSGEQRSAVRAELIRKKLGG